MDKRHHASKILPVVVATTVVFFAMLHLPFYFLRAYLGFVALVTLYAYKLGDKDTAFIGFLAFVPFFLEVLIFNLGLISLTSSDEDRLMQNTIIFGVQFVISLIALIPMVMRVELQQKIWKDYQPQLTLADTVFPWALLFSTIKVFCALIENYLRNGLGYKVQFFFSTYDITGYLMLSISASILGYMLYESHCEHKYKILPSLKPKGSR
ncbi:hypothetical protein [Pseudoalteromonas xiamenensis]|uniref:Transmembrane protein n=1 Tax=Pseudoalteromonas xiamenensis TaxID=882626 RepID=A0A975DIS8_9GAMM|nr:hypothetical protein [Pseudoalteromonas xiamenensis]QTH72497.1 hypothetical protein J5O05_06700 [Pseudoalteromonas xiamenensis]